MVMVIITKEKKIGIIDYWNSFFDFYLARS